jgi:DNA-binding NtrC family response regulator
MSSVLIIEDSRQASQYLSSILDKFVKMEVDTAETADEALHKLKDNEYDYILCDIELPKMKGPDILLNSDTHNAKVYFCSALDGIEKVVKKCLDSHLNVLGWKQKPVFRKDLEVMFKDA